MDTHINKLNLNIDVFNYINNLSVKELEKIIEYANDKYFNESSVISDNVFDILVDFLKFKDPKNKFLKSIGAPVKVSEKVKLPYSLFSMDKIKPPSNKLDKFTKKFNSPYILSDKLDGISALLVYTKDKSINFYTRGTSYEGQDITKLVKYLNLPNYKDMKKICDKANIKGKDNLIAFRGELIMKKSIFDSNWSNVMKNSRNTVSGLVNSKNTNPKLAQDTKYVVYEIVDPIMSLSEQYKIIKSFKIFSLVNYNIVNEINYEILSEYLKKRKAESKYLIDGIIVSNDNLNERPVDKNPKYAFAFKTILEEQKSVTKVIEVEWNQSKHGYLIPTIIIEPVNIGGVTIGRVTGSNAKNVIDNKIGKNAIVEIIRSGDVIPKIEKIINPGKVNMPKVDWHWNKTGVDIISNNLNCKEIHIKNIYTFFSTLEAKGLGLKMIEKIYNSGYNTIYKFLILSEKDLLTIPTIKEKSAQNIVTSIKKSISDVTIEKIIVASNKLGVGIGIKRIKSIFKIYPNLIETFSKWSKANFTEKIKQINGWDDKMTNQFVNNFSNFVLFFNEIKHLLKIKKNNNNTKGKYLNKTIVFSGFRDKELQKYIEEEGGIITNNITKNTDILVVKDINNKTSKLKKAVDLNIEIVLYEDI